MTVTSTPRRADYTGDGSTTSFEVPFQFFEISVYVDGALQIEGSDYIVVQEEPGLDGSIQFLSANGATPPNNSDVVILGTTVITQGVDYVNNDDFPAEVHEAALDRLTMIAQEMAKSFEGVVRAVPWHVPIEPVDFAAHPGAIVCVDDTGNIALKPVEQIVGDIDIAEAVAAANAAAVSEAAAAASATAAASSATEAAASAEAAAAATGVLSGNPHFLGLPEFEGGVRVGKNGGGDSIAAFYDDANDAWRSIYWSDTAHDWRVVDASATARVLWHSGNTASKTEAEAGTENTKGMTALRVAQAIAALSTGGDGFTSGVIMLFGNSAAPPGWSKLIDLHDYAIRIVSGTVGTSGAFSYSTVFASRTPAGTVNGTTLDTSRIPSHAHSEKAPAPGAPKTSASGTYYVSTGSGADATTGATGGGGSHDHGFSGTPMPFNVNTVDFIRAEKD